MTPTETPRSATSNLNRMRALALCATLALAAAPGHAQLSANLPPHLAASLPSLENLPRPATPPPEKGLVVPARVERWRHEAKGFEHGDGVPRDPLRAAELYCRAARHGDAESQFSLAWMLTNSRGIVRNEAEAAHLFSAAAEQGYAQARNILARMGTPRGDPPACLRAPEEDSALAAALAPAPPAQAPRPGGARPGSGLGAAVAAANRSVPPLPRHAPESLVRFVTLVAPEYRLDPHMVLAFIAAESNFDAQAVSPKNAQGLMQLIPETAARFGVRNSFDPVQNIHGGMAYLRWLMAYFEGDVVLVAAAYNAGEGAVERYRGVPPFAETRQYVWRIVSGAGGLLSHPFDAHVTPASGRMAQMVRPWDLRGR